jgi:hypothetical protein
MMMRSIDRSETIDSHFPHPNPTTYSPLELQQVLYDACVAALKSAGMQLLRPPFVEAAEGTLAYTVRGRECVELV